MTRQLRIGHVLADFTESRTLHLSEPESIDMDEVVLTLPQVETLYEWLGTLLSGLSAGASPETSRDECGHVWVCSSDEPEKLWCSKCHTALNRSAE